MRRLLNACEAVRLMTALAIATPVKHEATHERTNHKSHIRDVANSL